MGCCCQVCSSAFTERQPTEDTADGALRISLSPKNLELNLVHSPPTVSYVLRLLGLGICFSASLTHSLSLACTCCYGVISGIQDLFLCRFSDSHSPFNLTQSHTRTHSLSLVLVAMIKSKELKTKISLTHSLILSLILTLHSPRCCTRRAAHCVVSCAVAVGLLGWCGQACAAVDELTPEPIEPLTHSGLTPLLDRCPHCNQFETALLAVTVCLSLSHSHNHTLTHSHTYSLSLVLVVMIKTKELKTKISLTHSLILSLSQPGRSCSRPTSLPHFLSTSFSELPLRVRVRQCEREIV